MAGQALFTDPVEITAAYLFYLCRNHPFVDGNQRTAMRLLLCNGGACASMRP
jgi:death on curing protein